MNAQAEEFNDSSSVHRGHRAVFTDVNSDTASTEYKSFSLEGFDAKVFASFFESDAPTTNVHRLITPFISILDVKNWEAQLSKHRVLIFLLDRNSIQRGFLFPSSQASTVPSSFTRPVEPPLPDLDWSSYVAGFANEEIEDGMTASLGEKISTAIRSHGSEAVKQLKELLSSNELSPYLVSHSLRWVGRIKDSATFDSRLELLRESLRSESPTISDGAALGLAALGSKKAIPYLKAAVDQEKLPGLCADLEQVLKELQN